jgi:hypothetical protein
MSHEEGLPIWFRKGFARSEWAKTGRIPDAAAIIAPTRIY